MAVRRFGKKLLKITGYIFGGLAILLIAFHVWFIHYAKNMLEDIVSAKSNGKLQLTIEKLHYDYFNSRMKINGAVFITTDSSITPATYRFAVKEIRVQLKALLPFVFGKKLLIDSLHLQSPDIQVTNLRYPPGDSVKKNKEEISIPHEMGKVYNSIQDALQVLKVDRFQIDDGKFTLLNKIQPGQLPLIISNIHFHIDNLQVDSSKLTGKEKLFFSDNVVLRSNNQDITFPDGRHRLSFDRFRINIRKKMVEFDSCTISAIKTDNTKTSFSVFFDTLILSNIDFETLYKNEVIKADTVFCLNPSFKLRTNVPNNKGNAAKRSKLETIIEQLTGNLLLGYVIVNNASFDITTIKNGHPNSFTSHENNFEMQGLSIDNDEETPITVKSFAMAIRNYENFIKDSSYSVKFDSILFKDNHISLSNFLFQKLDKGKIINSFNVPHFYLEGLSWDELVFEKKINAERATMIHPYISYTVSNKKKGNQNIFESLDSINNYMDLQYLDVADGTINLKIKDNLQVKLKNASLSIQSHALLISTKPAELKNSLTKLTFGEGFILAGTLSLELYNINYIGHNGQLKAGSIHVADKEKNMIISLQDVTAEKTQVDEQTGSVVAEGIKWQKGDIKIHSPGGKKENDKASIKLKNVRGFNTSMSGIFGNKEISTKITSISFAGLEKKADSKLKLDGLDINGKQLIIKDNNLNLSVADYAVSDNKNSSFQGIVFKSGIGKMDADISIPSLTLTPHIESLINGNIVFEAVNTFKPVTNIHFTKKNAMPSEKKAGFPKIDISEIRLTQPEINFSQTADGGTTSFTWHGSKQSGDFLQISGLHSNADEAGLSAKNLQFHLSDFIFENAKRKRINTGDGKIAAELRDVAWEQKINQPLEWKAVVTNLDAKGFRFDSTGKSPGSFVINSAELREFTISSTTISSLQNLAAANTAFRLSKLNGHYTDAAKSLWWYNGGFDRKSNTFLLDSLIFRQALGKDSFNAKREFQTDYINTKTGAIRIGPVDIDTYIKDTTLKTGTVTIDNILFTDFKDKNLPFKAGIIKPLPVNLVKKIPFRLSVDSVSLTNAHVEYTETGEKSKEPGTIPVTRMTVILNNVKNHDLTNADSLELLAVGYLMDKVWTRLRVKESYTDSLGGFFMSLRMKAADLTVLNTALIPLSSVKLESAYLDTMSMRAVGKEYISLGEMKMFYHNLKVRFLINGDETKKSFLNGLRTFLANSFVIRNKNSSRKGLVFFIRMRERSAINYLIKTALSGMASSIGAKSSKKMMHKYDKELRQRRLPPIDFD